MPNTLPSLDALFRPRSVAVVGASRRPHQIGHEVIRNLVAAEFTGPVYPVNPSAEVVRSMHCYPSILDIPGPVDLAVVTVPARHVLQAARECAAKGVRGLVVFTAGFSEIGGEGAGREAELKALCEAHRMRLVGPNCMGLFNLEPSVRLNATFASTTPEDGGAAFASQSGALAEATLGDVLELGLGLRMFASLGNQADVSPHDLLEYWGDDDGVQQILMYLESFGDPARFLEAARRVTKRKPVIVVKAGRSAAGARAAMSHTGSLAGSEAVADAMLRQCGVLRVDTMKELFALARTVQAGRFPARNRVAIVTNAGGPAILATDACAAVGLEVVDFTPRTRARLQKAVPPEGSVRNPVDLLAPAEADRYDAALAAVLADRRVDLVLAIFVVPVMVDSAAVARVLVKHARRARKPLAVCVLGRLSKEAAIAILEEAGVQNHRGLEEAAAALAGLVRLAQMKDRVDCPAPVFEADRSRARVVVEAALSAGRTTLDASETRDLFEAYGIPMVPMQVVETLEEARSSAEAVGYPVVAKVEAPGVVHKSDVGGVLLDLRSREELGEAFRKLVRRFRRRKGRRHGPTDGPVRVVIQAMRRDGVEVFFGAARDPQFGRVMAFGLGGIHVEVLKDVVFRLHPLSRSDAEEMVDGIRGRAILQGIRGKPPVSREQLVEALLRASQLIADLPEVVELDINPFLAAWDPSRSCILDARVRLEPPRSP